MPKGRPAKPIEQKRAIGTLRNDRLPNQPIQVSQPATPPEPLKELGEAGSDFWQKIFETGGRWISHKTDITLCQIVAEQLDERDRLRTIVMSENGSRERSGLRELEKAIVSNLSLLGFTPSDRSRLGVAEVKAETKIEELRRKKEEMMNRREAGG